METTQPPVWFRFEAGSRIVGGDAISGRLLPAKKPQQ